MIFVNTKSSKIHGYTLAKLILRFSPQIKHFDMKWKLPTKIDLKIADPIKHQKPVYMALQDEKRCLASKASTYFHYKRG